MDTISRGASNVAAVCSAFKPWSMPLVGTPRLNANRTESTLRGMHATSSSDIPNRFLTDASARLSINSCCTASTPEHMANTIGVSPTLLRAFTSALRFTSTETASAWPCSAATCIGRMPVHRQNSGESWRSVQSSDALHPSRASMTWTLPNAAATSKALVPGDVSVAEVKSCLARNSPTSFAGLMGCDSVQSMGKPRNKVAKDPIHRRHSFMDPEAVRCCILLYTMPANLTANVARSASTEKAPQPTGSVSQSCAAARYTV
mmetsp:Transcript_8697/g.25006  ORF Transcript_8697/g.25006 Transcript_8697/m.25006 type:complete len:261 (-) Transcript_8697:156-938(-)